MEIKATLQKPCTETERIDFIIQQNHRLGYIVKETEEQFEAWGYTEEEKLEKAKALKLKEAETKLDEKRYSFDFIIILHEQECEFDSTKKTQDDLQTAAIATSNGGVYPDWVTNNGIKLDLTFEDIQTVFNTIFPLVSPLYIKQMGYIAQIKQAETVEEVNAIIIDYEE